MTTRPLEQTVSHVASYDVCPRSFGASHPADRTEPVFRRSEGGTP